MAKRAPRQNAAARKEEILNAAVGEIERRGFANTRVVDVADSLGVSQALIFYHFASKDRLLADAFEFAANRDLARLDRALVSGKSALERLRAVLRLYSPAVSTGAWRLWIDAWGEALRVAELRDRSRQLDLRWKEAMAALIDEGREAGEFACDDPHGAAWRITALLDGLAIQVVVHRNVLTREQMTSWVQHQAERELGLPPGSLD